jgi:hypothetical protein
MTAAMAAHIPPADAPENTSIETSWSGAAGLGEAFAAYHCSKASRRKSRTPAV